MQERFDNLQIVREVDDRLGRRIKVLREQRGWSQSDFRERLEEETGVDWHQTTVAKIEAGQRPLKVAEAVAVGIVLGLSPADLLGPVTEAGVGERQFLEGQRVELDAVRRFLALRSSALDLRLRRRSQLDEVGEEADRGVDREAP